MGRPAVGRPYTQVSIRSLNITAYGKHKIYVVPDTCFGVTNYLYPSFLLEAKVKRITMGINEQIGTADLEFPSRQFGTHARFVSPIRIVIDNSYNTLFKGFLVVENSVLNQSEDQLNYTAYDYKWFISKVSKIRGRIYTGDNYQKATDLGPYGIAPNKVYSDLSKFEKFRYYIPSSNTDRFDRSDIANFRGNDKTVFNEGGFPDCASDDIGNYASFKYDQDQFYAGNISWSKKVGNKKYYWNYATILNYIGKYYINSLFTGGTSQGATRVYMSDAGLVKILRYGDRHGMDLIIPKDFDLTGLNPVQAIDKVVKAIPGSWYWYMRYASTGRIYIEIENNSDDVLTDPGKSLFIGSWNKVNEDDNKTNVASVSVTRSVENSVTHAVAVGGGLEIETSLEYVPGWQQYLRPTSDFDDEPSLNNSNWEEYSGGFIPDGYYISNFKNPLDFQKYKEFLAKFSQSDSSSDYKLQSSMDSEDEKRYAMLYRVYVFPTYKFDIVNFPDVTLSQYFDAYRGHATYLHELIHTHVIIPRQIKGPLTDYKDIDRLKNPLSEEDESKTTKSNSEQEPFVFLYDYWKGQTEYDDSGGISQQLKEDIMESKKWIVPSDDSDEDGKDSGYSMEAENRIVLFNNPQISRITASARHSEQSIIPDFVSGLEHRKVFVTCRIVCDVPLIKDKLNLNTELSNARLVTQDIYEDAKAVIRVDAYYPTPKGSVGNALTYEYNVNGTPVGAVRKIGSGGSTDSIVGSKLIDWNKFDYSEDKNSALVYSDYDQLEQIIQILIEDQPLWEENIEADLGRVDVSYDVGDRINRIVNSELEDGSGGFYNLKAIVNRIEFANEGDTDAYTTRLSMTNYNNPIQRRLEERKI